LLGKDEVRVGWGGGRRLSRKSWCGRCGASALGVLDPHVDLVELQVMGLAVTRTAGGELPDDGLRMWRLVAVAAGGDGLVTVPVAEDAGHVPVPGMTSCQKVVDGGVAGATIFGRDLFRVGDHQRPVGWMAPCAVRLGHGVQMPFVASEAFGHEPVPGMTCGAGKGRVDTGVRLKLFDLAFMAGCAFAGEGPGQPEIERCMRVRMAG